MDLDACLCRTVRALAEGRDGAGAGAGAGTGDDAREAALAAALSEHLQQIRTLLAQSKTLARQVPFRVNASNQRTSKAMIVGSVDRAPLDDVCARCEESLDSFWAPADDAVHTGLARRIVCVVVFLRSRLAATAPPPPSVARLLQRNTNLAELRNSGRKYIKIARRLGGFGALFWLPLDIPHSTYERYLNMDDEDVFGHLQSLDPHDRRYADVVQRLVLGQLQDLPPASSYHNLFQDYGDILPASDQLLLLLYALGGANVPDMLFKSLRAPQRRWNADGEMQSHTAAEFGLPAALVELAADDTALAAVLAPPYVTKTVDVNGGGIVLWSLTSEAMAFFASALQPQTVAELETLALRVVCFGCPPCYEGNTYWTDTIKKAIWPLLERIARPAAVQEPLRTPLLEAVLYFCERDSVSVRKAALVCARALLRRSMPYYLHASIALFESVLLRLDGEIVKSRAELEEFVRSADADRNRRGTTPQPVTRRDGALRGRLHISQIENKIKCYDKDVPSFIYRWEAAHPLSSFEVEVTCRLQSAAARYFQSIGDHPAARASLEQFLALNAARPSMSVNTHRLLVGRLADIYCEMGDFARAAALLRPALDGIIDNADHNRRPHRRLLLAKVETLIGTYCLDDADQLLDRQWPHAAPAQLNDLYDEQLHMRSLLAWARIAHLRVFPEMTDGGSPIPPPPDAADATAEALRRWQHALDETHRLRAMPATDSFLHAAIYLSRAHAELLLARIDEARASWAAGVDILRREKCEFWIPIVPTLWLRRIVIDVHQRQGWSFRMMLPGGRPDITWP